MFEDEQAQQSSSRSSLPARSRSAHSPAAAAGTGGGDGDKVTITWWHNGTGEPLLGFWEGVAADFEDDHPNVTVKVEAYQNEELQRTLIPNALRSGSGADLFQEWGGGELAAQVEAGYVMDITDQVGRELDAIGGRPRRGSSRARPTACRSASASRASGTTRTCSRRPASTAPPTTLDELNDAVAKLKATGIAPIAVGAGDKWPAAHWWYNFALKACSPDALKKAPSELRLLDDVLREGRRALKEFIDIQAVPGRLPRHPRAAGRRQLGRPARQRQGRHGAHGPLEPRRHGRHPHRGDRRRSVAPEFLGWFNFPGIAGSEGDPTAALGGGDGFSCAARAPPECVELLKYILSVDVQKRFGESGAGLPVTKGSEAGIADPNLLQVLDGHHQATYVQLWLDTAYGTTVGNAMNDAIVATLRRKRHAGGHRLVR